MAEKKKMPLRQKIRLFVQLAFTALSNGYFKGFAEGKIYKGPTKYACVPGLNCYSCPGALCGCPIGSLQATLTSRQFTISLYALGFITVFGTLFGRLTCGFLCPFGLLQELLFKIPFIKKLRSLPGEKVLRLLRFLILALFVIVFPMCIADMVGVGDPWFCKYICPVGTLEGGIPLVLLNSAMRETIGFLYTWKVFLLIVTLVFSVLIYRPFCRYICPLGAIYGLFNKISFHRYQIDEEKCTKCDRCRKACHMDIPVHEKPNSIDCIRCGACKDACSNNAITDVIDIKKLAKRQ